MRNVRGCAVQVMSVFQDAQHEAAHVVVGVALGLRLDRASVREETHGDETWLGFALFYEGPRVAMNIMTAAGVVWERKVGDLAHASEDLKLLRRGRVRTNAELLALERAAWAILEGRASLHARVTRALLEGDVTGADLRAMVRETPRF